MEPTVIGRAIEYPPPISSEGLRLPLILVASPNATAELVFPNGPLVETATAAPATKAPFSIVVPAL